MYNNLPSIIAVRQLMTRRTHKNYESSRRNRKPVSTMRGGERHEIPLPGLRPDDEIIVRELNEGFEVE